MDDAFNLQRFVLAQADVYSTVIAELQAGRKSTHWIWFIFPQLRALGRSETAQKFGITSLAEAVEYLDQPTLGSRLIECTELMLAVHGKTALQILGSPDDLKFCSCMTLFGAAKPDMPIWNAALQKYCAAQPDHLTLALI